MNNEPIDDLTLIDRLCDLYESQLKAGESANLRSYLKQAPESLRNELLRELVSIDVAYHDADPAGRIQQLQREYPEFESLLDRATIGIEPTPSAGFESRSSQGISSGQKFGRYEIGEPLGQGGMGMVYRARDTVLEREIALKFPRISDDEQLTKRFYLEARTAAMIQHANVCPVFDVGEINGIHFIAMALIDGRPLGESSDYALPVDERRVAELIAKVASALQTAHEQEVIHRDLKPANIMINSSGEPIVMDFGLAKRISDLDVRLTKPGAVIGTPAYMSPEQVEGRELSPLSDVYSLGVIMYELVSGQLPFQGTIGKIMSDILSSQPTRLTTINQKISPQFEAICLRMMAKKESSRFESMVEVTNSLKNYLGGVAQPGQSNKSTAAKMIKSLAILPLENSSEDEEIEYLSDGITESLIYSMSRMDGLRVLARNSVFRYKQSNIDVQTVGQELDVEAILLGRVDHRRNRLRISVELVNSADGSQIWGARYKREPDDLLDLDDEIASEIAGELKLNLQSGEDQSPAQRATEHGEAYQHYLKGRFHWNKRNHAELKKAIEHFEIATQLDPKYALAYAGLADSYGLLLTWGNSKPQEVALLAREMAERALKLDPTLAEAYTSLGYCNVVYGWDWPQAEKLYRKAILLNSNYSNAHHWLGYLLMCWGRFEEAHLELESARVLDPLSLIISANVGYCLYFERRYQDAIEKIRETIDMDDSMVSPHYYLGMAYSQIGDFDQAIAELEKSVELSGGVPGDLGSLGYAYALAGDVDQVQRVTTRLAELASQNYTVDFQRALIKTAEGQLDDACNLLEAAIEKKDLYWIYVKMEPRFDKLRKVERFSRLYRATGLPA